MKISCSDYYMAHDVMDVCDLPGCQRQYCSECRWLWRDCESAITTYDGASRPWYEVLDCPKCRTREIMKGVEYAERS